MSSLLGYYGQRIAAAAFVSGNRDWQAAEYVSVTGWHPSNEFIYSVAIGKSGSGSYSGTVKLQWRNYTDGGSWTDLSSSGELKWGTSTDLVNNATLTEAESGLTGTTNWNNGKEKEGANSTTYSLPFAINQWTAYQWAIDPSDAPLGKVFHFRVYDVTHSDVVGGLGGPDTYAEVTITTFGGTASITGQSDLVVGQSSAVANKTHLTPAMTTALEAAGLKPVVLASFAFDSGTVNLASETITVGVTEYSGLIHSVGEFEDLNQGGLWGISLPACTIRVINTESTPFSDNFKTDPIRKVLVTLSLWFRDSSLAATDILELDRFYVESYRLTEFLCDVRIVSPMHRFNKRIGTRLDTTTYPGLDPDWIGRYANIIYGDNTEVRTIPVDAGGATTLTTAGGIDSSQTTGIRISQGKRDTLFPATGAPAKLAIDGEEISYTGRTDNGGDWTLTGVTRGINGTTATTHSYGAAVYSLSNLDGTDRSSYIYMVADHPVKSIGAVFVDGILQVGGYTAYTGQSGDNHPSGDYNSKGVIDFSAKPTIAKQINVNIVDGISVNNGNLAATETPHVHGLAGNYAIIYGDSGSLNGSPAWTGTAASMYDQSENGAYVTRTDTGWGGSGVDYARVSFDSWGGGTINDVRVCISYAALITSGNIDFNGNSLPDTAGFRQVAKFNNTTTYETNLDVVPDTGANLQVDIYEIWQEVYADTASASAGVGLSGTIAKTGTVTLGTGDNSTADLVIGENVSCNVQGYQDDGSGTWTGTPSALIENPAGVMEHFLDTYTDIDPDDNRFAIAKTFLTAASSVFASVLRNGNVVYDILQRMMNQSRLKFWWSRGYGRVRYIPDAPTAEYTIDRDYMFRYPVVAPTMKPEIINTAQLHYDPYWATRAEEPGKFYGLTDQAQDATSVSENDTCNAPEFLEFCEWINDSTTAEDVRDYLVARFKDPKDRLKTILLFAMLNIEEGDFVAITHNSNAHSYDGTEVFFVERVPLYMIPTTGEDGILTPPGIDVSLIREV